MTNQPSEIEEIPDADHEQLIDRVAAIDVAKEFGKVCVRVPDPARPGRRISRIWDIDAATNAVLALAERLVSLRIVKVTIESTSGYWRIWFYLLEAAGLDVQLVNARDAKNVPGRPKTDKHDCLWSAKLTEKGLLRASFVPPAPIRVLRDYTRMRTDFTREVTRHWQRMEKLLEDALIKISAVASRLDTRSTRDMIEALIAGGTRPEGPRRAGPRPDARQTRRARRGPHRPVRQPPRRTGPNAAGSDRRPRAPDQRAHHPDRCRDRRDPRRRRGHRRRPRPARPGD
jgi:hypothetical protein